MSAGEQKFCSWLSNDSFAAGHLTPLLPLMMIEASFLGGLGGGTGCWFLFCFITNPFAHHH